MAAAFAVTAHLSPSLSRSVRNACPVTSPSISPISRNGSAFATGSPLLRSRIRVMNRTGRRGGASLSIRSEQTTNSLDAWIGRAAMIGFAVSVTVEVSTGKGLIENFGLVSPLPTAALAVMGLVGGVTAVYIFQTSSSKN